MTNKAVFTVKAVINNSEPILYVVHDKEGEWQFLTGGDVSMPDMMIVSLEQVIALDPSLGDLSWLPNGTEASRKSMNDDWVISVYED